MSENKYAVTLTPDEIREIANLGLDADARENDEGYREISEAMVQNDMRHFNLSRIHAAAGIVAAIDQLTRATLLNTLAVLSNGRGIDP